MTPVVLKQYHVEWENVFHCNTQISSIHHDNVRITLSEGIWQDLGSTEETVPTEKAFIEICGLSRAKGHDFYKKDVELSFSNTITFY